MTSTLFDIDDRDIATLVPDVYADFRPIVADGLAFFLDHLSPARLSDILEAQANLPADAEISTRIVQLAHACPALHKLGQVIAHHRELDPTLRRRLQRLETMTPRTAMDEIRPVLQSELADVIAPFNIELADQPLAEASVAVVVPLTYADPADPDRRIDGVAKVLKPNAAEMLEEDLAIFGKLADFLDEDRDRYGLPSLQYGETFDEVRELLTNEVRFEQEQANLRAAARQYARNPRVQIPAPLPFCTPNVTAMQRVFGTKVTELPANSSHDRRDLARTLIQALVTDVLFSRKPETIFHADAHAGNLFATDDGRLALLDWALTGRLTLPQRQQLAQVVLGVLLREPPRILRAISALSSQSLDTAVVSERIDESLRTLDRRALPGPLHAMRLLDSLALAGVRFPPDLLMFRKTFFTLEGTYADVCPDCRLDRTLFDLTLARILDELPLRMFQPPLSREFSTHLSTFELLQVATRLI